MRAAPLVAAGETYLVRGTYTLAGEQPATLNLSAEGRNTGRLAVVDPGSGEFQAIAQPLEVVAGREDTLDLLVGDLAKEHLKVRLRIVLRR